MNTTDAQGIVIIIASITLAVTTILTPILTYLNGKKTESVKATLENASIQQDKNAAKLEVIHQATNGGLSAMQTKLDTALKEIEYLKNAKIMAEQLAKK